MKNLKKILLSLMVLFLAFAFIGCPAEPEPELPVTPEPTPEPETPVNNFKGNVFVAEFSLGSYSDYWGYIEFLDDTNGKMGQAGYDEGKPIPITEQPFTYSVTDDVATIKATMDGMQFTVTTSKLTDGRFTFSTEGVDTVTGETYSVLVTCTKGDKSLFDVWTVVYEEQDDLMEDFFYGFEDYVKVLVEEDDYNLDTANKKIVLTENGYKKCCQPWTILQGEDRYEDEDYIESMLMFNMIGLKETTDYTINIETSTITVTESGMEKIQDAMWTISYPAEDFEIKQLEFMLLAYYESFGLVDSDYTKNDETKTITLTESGWAKVQALMGGGSDDETWTVMYNGITVDTFESLEAAGAFASNIGLVENVDYTVNNETQTITLTDAGWIKVQAMGGGSEEEGNGGVTSEKWTGVDPEGIPFTTFESFEEVKEHVEVNGLELGVDYTLDEEKHIIYLLAKEG